MGDIPRAPRPISAPLVSTVDWFNDQLSRSCITPDAATNMGWHIETSHPKGYNIVYTNWDGNFIFNKRRVQYTEGDEEPSENGKPPKGDRRYFTPKGQPSRLFIPRALPQYDPNPFAEDVGALLFIVEGEKKAACVQLALAGKGIPALVVGIGGVNTLTDTLRQDLDRITMRVTLNGNNIARNVFIAMDWFPENVSGIDKLLSAYLRKRGARPHALRWPIAEAGEQKVDDWIYGGGDITDAIVHSEKLDLLRENELDKMVDLFNEQYTLVLGDVFSHRTRSVFEYGAFKRHTQHHWLDVMKGPRSKERMYGHKIWMDDDRCSRCDGLTMDPVSIGESSPLMVGGKFNTFPGWPEVDNPIAPPDGHIDELIATWKFLLEVRCATPEESKFQEQTLAHVFRVPKSYRSNALIYTDVEGGSGKGLIWTGIHKAVGPLAFRMGEEEYGKFNVNIVGKLFLNIDDAERQHQKKIATAFKQIMGNPMIAYGVKNGSSGNAPNYALMIIATNDTSPFQASVHDRRSNFFRGRRMTVEEIKRVTDAQESPYWREAIYEWSKRVDLTDYNPGQLGPESQARLDAIEHDRPPVLEFFANPEEYTVKEVLTVQDIMIILDSKFKHASYKASTITSEARRLGLGVRGKSSGLDRRYQASNGIKYVLICVKNQEHWKHKDTGFWGAHAMTGVGAGG